MNGKGWTFRCIHSEKLCNTPSGFLLEGAPDPAPMEKDCSRNAFDVGIV